MATVVNLLVLSVAVLAIAPNSAQPKRIACAELKRILDARANAFRQEQLEEYMKAVAPDFEEKLTDGTTLNRAQATDRLREFFRTHRSIATCAYTIKECTVHGNQATIVAEQVLGYPSIQQNRGGNEFILGESQSRQTWVRGQDGWKLRHSQLLGATFTSTGSKKGGRR